FITIVISTLIITYWAARRSETPYQYYAAAGSLTGVQNGLAIAGDFISAASFLGIVGTIAINGFDGFIYSIGFLVSYLVFLFFIAVSFLYLIFFFMFCWIFFNLFILCFFLFVWIFSILFSRSFFYS